MRTDDRPRPKWLQEQIDLKAAQAKPATCPTCGADVLVGLDGDRCAWPAVADPPLGKGTDPAVHLRAVVALLSGRRVYAVVHGELHRLAADQLASGVGDPRTDRGPRLPLCLSHICNETLEGTS